MAHYPKYLAHSLTWSSNTSHGTRDLSTCRQYTETADATGPRRSINISSCTVQWAHLNLLKQHCITIDSSTSSGPFSRKGSEEASGRFRSDVSIKKEIVTWACPVRHALIILINSWGNVGFVGPMVALRIYYLIFDLFNMIFIDL